MLFGVAFFVCLAVVFWVMQDNAGKDDVTKQQEVAEKDRDKIETEQKKEMEKELGVGIPTLEEVERVLSVTDNQMLYEELLMKEYGKAKGAYIFTAYVREELPSNTDTEQIAQIKKSLIAQAYDEKAYPSDVDLLSGLFEIAQPFSTVDAGFQTLNDKMKTGYLNSMIFHDETKNDRIPRIVLSAVVWVTENMNASEFETLLKDVTVTVADNKGIPFNSYYRTMYEKGNVENPLREEKFKNMNYLNPYESVFENHKQKDVQIYAGTPIVVSYIVELENVNVKTVESLDTSFGKANFKLVKPSSNSTVAYKLN